MKQSKDTDAMIKTIAEVCIYQGKPLSVAARMLNTSPQRVGHLKLMPSCHEEACRIAFERSAGILKRKDKNGKPLTQRKIRDAVRLFVNENLTLTELDERFGWRAGTAKLCTGHRVWGIEKRREIKRIAKEEMDAE